MSESQGNPELIAIMRAEIADAGRIPFARFMELALYHPVHGYYAQPHRKPGRGGDFMTSPELHPFFGFALSRQIADTWQAMGSPDHFVVREHGASSGGLAYDIIAALSETTPEILDVLDYRLIEVNPHRAAESERAMGEAHLSHLVRTEHPDDLRPEPGVVLANEVADALPVHRLVVEDGQLRERWVTLKDDAFADETGPLSESVMDAGISEHLIEAGVNIASLPDGSELDVSPASAGWVRGIAEHLPQGLAVIIDYGYPAAELYREHRLAGTVRAYAQHTVTDDPYLRVGEQDLTTHVDFSLLAKAGEDAGLTRTPVITQGEFLTNLQLGEWLMRLQRDPDTTLEEYYQAQAATIRLIDPTGLGRFRVLGLMRGLDETPVGWRTLSLEEQMRSGAAIF